MTRRASLPGAEELFRSTAQTVPPAAAVPVAPKPAVQPLPAVSPPEAAAAKERTSRPKHEQKVTFYCTQQDLTELEKVRLALRAEHRLPSDRSRIVRAALTEMLDDFAAEGSRSRLVRRLREDV